ncbi:MAG: DUF4190 domain-containing protein [Candidatus Sumerlaeia bacterium]|nr:DUF4190 domain-containing protein [Candidatus Sumerlaeia bacterium]
MAKVSVITGAVSIVMGFCCGLLVLPLGLTAIVTGYLAKSKNTSGADAKFGLYGMVLGAVGLGISIVFGLIGAILF